MGSLDKLQWIPLQKGIFKVKDFFEALSIAEGSGFLWKSVWRTKSPQGLRFLCSRWALGKIITLDNLRKKQVLSLIDAACARKMESQSIIYSFIARLPMLCGEIYLARLVCFGSCHLCACWCSSERTRSAVV